MEEELNESVGLHKMLDPKIHNTNVLTLDESFYQGSCEESSLS